MTTPQEARKAAIGFHVTSEISKILHGLADQLEAVTADRDSWVQQASDRVADAVRFIEERDGLAAARDTWQQQCKERTDEGLVWWQQRNEANAKLAAIEAQEPYAWECEVNDFLRTTRIKRVSELWVDQGINITPLYLAAGKKGESK